ncbi:peptide chain release factor N(5)-glutamine methyltransferase [Shimia ponticola]|uniref:peptide chain release factor N(5)-glutamine methyltransferase n=1 Tax=Shimia ponticola TaxID=2582893 RepID=UPI0011BE8860|nr:peptide chain release factor N(5)-glutamine methyltransferase [Shimia ponticola]
MTIAAALRYGAAELGDMREARLLMAGAIGCDVGRLTLMAHDALPDDIHARFRDHVARRINGEPVSHILGQRAFWGRMFRVTPDVLDPRPETETLIAAALEVPFNSVLDLGTGSGCIAITLLAERPQVTGMAVDLSAAALAIASTNAERHDVTDRLCLETSDWFSAVTGTHDLIVSNPPYIPADDLPDLMPEVRDHEPTMALTDGADGLTPYRVILSQASDYLSDGGVVMAEFGAGQWPDIQEIAMAAGWGDVTCKTDLDGRPRVLVAQNPQKRPIRA